MHGEESSAALSPKTMMSRFAILLLVSIGVGAAGGATVLEAHQATAVGVFLAIIMGTLFFWGFRLAIARRLSRACGADLYEFAFDRPVRAVLGA